MENVRELIESFINGNRSCVIDELFHNGTPASIALFFYKAKNNHDFSDRDFLAIVNGLQDRQFEANQK